MNLLHELKTNENTRRIFGKKELKIIEKQLSGINLTQSEKNRLSRDIRKKFEFISFISRFSDNFSLKKGSDVKRLINESVDIILEYKNPKNIKRIVLFGSVAENKIIFNSDIDLAVEFFNIDLTEATLFRIKVLGEMNSKLDVQVYNVLPDKIKAEIDSKGKLLYSQGKKVSGILNQKPRVFRMS